MEKNGHHIVQYRTYAIILAILLVLTMLSVAITSVELGRLSVTAALLFAAVKASLVLVYFMHLKFDQRMYAVMVGFVLTIFLVVVVITFLDYSFR